MHEYQVRGEPVYVGGSSDLCNSLLIIYKLLVIISVGKTSFRMGQIEILV